MMARCRIFFAVLMLVASFLWAQDRDAHPREKVRIGIFDLGPFMMTVENDAAGGIAIDFWRERIAPLMGVDIEVSGPYPIPRLEWMLETGKVDLIPYITKIPARESRFLYPANPYTTISPCIVVRRDSPLTSIDSQEDLFGMRIGFITNAYIPPFVRHDKIKLDLITSTDFRHINHQKLMHGRVDALLDINYLSFVYEMRRRGYLEDIRIIPLNQERISIYSIFAATARGEALRVRYESALARIPKGSFDVLVDRYFSHGR